MSSLEIAFWFAALLFPVQQIVASITFTLTAVNELDEVVAFHEELAPLFNALRYVTSVPLLLAVWLAVYHLAQMRTVEGWLVLVFTSISVILVIGLFDRLMKKIETSRVERLLLK